MSHVATSHRPKKHHEEEHENHERWAVSYGDMMTVLLALFIVLFAMSQVDVIKFEQLRDSLAIGFGNNAPNILPGSSGAMDGVESFEIVPNLSAESGAETHQVLTPDDILDEDTAKMLAAALEYEQLADIQQNIAEHLDAAGLGDYVQFRINDRGLVVGMVGSEVFFASDQATMTPAAQRVIDEMAAPLRAQGRQISIEGHANIEPSRNYPSNWELSSARATQVLRRFVEYGGVAADQIGAVGYGDARPLITPADSPAALQANRRVDIVIISSASEEIRNLLPEIAKALADGTITQEDLDAAIAEDSAAPEPVDLSPGIAGDH